MEERIEMNGRKDDWIDQAIFIVLFLFQEHKYTAKYYLLTNPSRIVHHGQSLIFENDLRIRQSSIRIGS